MPTIVDSLILTLGVKADDYFKTQRDISDKQKKFKEEIVKHGSEIEGSLKVTSAALGAFGKQLLGLYTLFTGGKEIAEFITDITNVDAALGRISKTTGVSAERLATYQSLFEKQGAAAGEAIKMFQSLENSRQQFLTRGTGPFKEIAITLSQLGVAYDAREPIEKIFLKAAAAIQKLAATNPQLAHFYAVRITGSEAAAQALIKQGAALDEQLKREAEYVAKTPEEIRAAQARIEAWVNLRNAGISLGDAWLTRLTPAILAVDRELTHLMDTARTEGWWATFKAGLWDLKTALESLQETAENWYREEPITNYFAAKLKVAVDAIKPILREIVDICAADWEDIKKITSDFVKGLPDYATQVLEGFKTMFSSAFDWLKKSFNEIWQKILGKTPFGEAGIAPAGGVGGAVPEGTTPGTRTDQTTGARAHGAGTPGSGGGGGSPGGQKGRGEYTVKKAYDLLKAQGATDEEARTLAAIAQPESGGNPRNINDNPRTGDLSYGLWQINMLGRMGPERRAKYGLTSNEQLYDPATNARIAIAMHRAAGGYRDWSTYKSGAYMKYMSKAGPSADEPAAPAAPAPGRSGVTTGKYKGEEYQKATPGGPESATGYGKQSSLGLGYNTAMLGAQTGAAYHNTSMNNSHNHTQTAETHVGVVNVHTAATDASGIARDIKPALERTARGMQANYSLA